MIPAKVDGYRSEVINALRDCVIALWPKQSATMLCNVAADGTAYEVKRPAVVAPPIDFPWNIQKTGDLKIKITPGDIEMGPDTVIVFGTVVSPGHPELIFSGCAESADITAGSTEWWVWVNVFMEPVNEGATMYSAASITALTADEKKKVLQKRIAKITIASDKITDIKRYQWGNIFIPRL